MEDRDPSPAGNAPIEELDTLLSEIRTIVEGSQKEAADRADAELIEVSNLLETFFGETFKYADYLIGDADTEINTALQRINFAADESVLDIFTRVTAIEASPSASPTSFPDLPDTSSPSPEIPPSEEGYRERVGVDQSVPPLPEVGEPSPGASVPLPGRDPERTDTLPGARLTGPTIPPAPTPTPVPRPATLPIPVQPPSPGAGVRPRPQGLRPAPEPTPTPTPTPAPTPTPTPTPAPTPTQRPTSEQDEESPRVPRCPPEEPPEEPECPEGKLDDKKPPASGPQTIDYFPLAADLPVEQTPPKPKREILSPGNAKEVPPGEWGEGEKWIADVKSVLFPELFHQKIEGDFCTRIMKFRRSLISLGELVGNGAEFDEQLPAIWVDILREGAGAIWTAAQKWIHRFTNRLIKIVTDSTLLSTWKLMRDGMKEVTWNTVPEHTRINAAVHWLEFLADASVKLSTGYTYQEELSAAGVSGTGANLPMAGLTGIEFGGKRELKDGYSAAHPVGASFEAGLKFFLVPLIDLARWIRDRANLPAIPTLNEVQNAYLHGGLNDTEYRCLLMIHEADQSLQSKLLYANRAKLDVNTLLSAYRRKYLSEAEYLAGLRELGFMSSREAGLLEPVSRPLPGVSDLIRFMVRDVEDANIVERFQLDAEFEAKYKGDTEQWAKSQGLERDVVRAYWRAHWRLPGLGQIYEMVHRLRADSLDENNRKLETTIEDARAALAQDDVPIFWRDRLIAISYHPLTRVDVQRAYILGILSREQVVDAYQNGGYTKENAETLAEFTQRRRENTIRSHPASKGYVAGAVSWEQATKRLAQFRLKEQEAIELRKELDSLRETETTKICMRATRKQFLTGSVDKEGARVLLLDRGIPADHVLTILRRWECERSSKAKEAPASTLCSWFAAGLLTAEEFSTRLIRIGYSVDDAERIVGVCSKKAKIAAETAEERVRRKEKVQDEQAERERKARERAESLRLEKLARKQSSQASKQAARKAKLRKAAEQLADHRKGPVDDAAAEIQATILDLVATYGMSQAEAESVIIGAAKGLKKGLPMEWEDYVARLASADVQFDTTVDDLTPDPDES